MKLTYCITRDVKPPRFSSSMAAGLDFFVPNDFPGVTLPRGHSVNIPSGIRVLMGDGVAMVAVNKSGVAVNKGLQVGACLIDPDYRGEVHLHVTNIGKDTVDIAPGEKLVQFLVIAFDRPELALVDEREYESTAGETGRGRGAFGSTGG